MNLETSLYMHFNSKFVACIAIINCLISLLLHVTIPLVKPLQLHLTLCNWLTPHNLNLYKPPDNADCHRIYFEDFHFYLILVPEHQICIMAEAAVVKSNNASKKRKSDDLGGNKNKKSLANTSTAKISESFEDSLSSLLISSVPTSEFTEAKATAPNLNEGAQAVIKRTFHLGGTKYVIYQGSHGLIENIYLKECEDGEKNQGIKLLVPKLVVILHYVEFIMTAIQKISDGKKEVDSSYYLGSGIYVTCAFPYRNVSIRLWKMAIGKKYPTPQGISFRFNEWNEFIKVT